MSSSSFRMAIKAFYQNILIVGLNSQRNINMPTRVGLNLKVGVLLP